MIYDHQKKKCKFIFFTRGFSKRLATASSWCTWHSKLNSGVLPSVEDQTQ